jgi:hypothetical protein
MTKNRPPIPWKEIRTLVRHLSNTMDNPKSVDDAVRVVRDWLDPKRPTDPDQMTMLGTW